MAIVKIASPNQSTNYYSFREIINKKKKNYIFIVIVTLNSYLNICPVRQKIRRVLRAISVTQSRLYGQCTYYYTVYVYTKLCSVENRLLAADSVGLKTRVLSVPSSCRVTAVTVYEIRTFVLRGFWTARKIWRFGRKIFPMPANNFSPHRSPRVTLRAFIRAFVRNVFRFFKNVIIFFFFVNITRFFSRPLSFFSSSAVNTFIFLLLLLFSPYFLLCVGKFEK